MTLFRTPSLTRQLTGRAQRLVGQATGNRSREIAGATREYAGIAASAVGGALVGATARARRHPVLLTLAIGAGVGAIAAAYLISRRRAQAWDDGYDEHDPTRERPTDASGNAFDGSGEDNPIPGDRGLY